MGVNAAVVGILFSALYTPIWTSSILSALISPLLHFFLLCSSSGSSPLGSLSLQELSADFYYRLCKGALFTFNALHFTYAESSLREIIRLLCFKLGLTVRGFGS